jgi:benzoyl-CoA-dihydrodiol lyase
MVNFETSPAEYRHWKLKFEGAVAKLEMAVLEDEVPGQGYKLKLNSYDLSVDIELADAVERLRFEHPEVKVVIITSLKPRIFCAGANIYRAHATIRPYAI